MMMLRSLITLLTLSALSIGAHAHPHNKTEQQALLSIGLDKALLRIVIVPSIDEGAEIYAHLDTDNNGVVSPEEAMTFADQVVNEASLLINGKHQVFAKPTVKMPDYKKVASGLGQIEILAESTVEIVDTEANIVKFEIAYEELSHNWFVQPFFFEDLNIAMGQQNVERSDEEHHALITLAP